VRPRLTIGLFWCPQHDWRSGPSRGWGRQRRRPPEPSRGRYKRGSSRSRSRSRDRGHSTGAGGVRGGGKAKWKARSASRSRSRSRSGSRSRSRSRSRGSRSTSRSLSPKARRKNWRHDKFWEQQDDSSPRWVAGLTSVADEGGVVLNQLFGVCAAPPARSHETTSPRRPRGSPRPAVYICPCPSGGRLDVAARCKLRCALCVVMFSSCYSRASLMGSVWGFPLDQGVVWL
jgi:hypothetical protein